ncbi:hypothetical protein [Vallitalea sp.]|jgi:hypothetical protein|uniref:hypothetical protein n=1 Tax=Vallitalea sp. TaxID=1882829 RepID=UPI0025E10A11|nr:hypothetical protein [Vallitalea sp.]MCT4688044.1 hypothetical protein [Vallitalea sp.]
MLLKTKRLAYLGILLAINQIILLSSTIFVSNTIIIFALAAILIGVVIIEFNLASGVSFYIASSILALILVPDKIQIITYIAFFGLYSIVKYLIEILINRKNLSVIIEVVLKIVYFNMILVIYYFIIKQFVSVLPFNVTWWVIMAGEVFFIAYDYFLGYFLHIYASKIKPRLKKYL